MERVHKILPSTTMSFDAETGVVDAYVSITGILDDDTPPDLIELGAFGKSIGERGPNGAKRIRSLWQHDWREVIGQPVLLEEHGRERLPESVLARFPQASGGLFAKTQFVLEVQRGREAYALYKAGAMDEWSIGFDPVISQFEKAAALRADGREVTFRRIKEARLWEYSPVTWGANPGTTTTAVKVLDEESPGKNAQVELYAKLAGLLGLPVDCDVAELMAEVEKRLKCGGPVDGSPVQAQEIARLRAKAVEIGLNIGAKA